MDAKVNATQTTWLESILSDIHARHLENTEGHLADYIPELAAVDPNRFGLAIATKAGELYRVGDAEHPFTIQSISKAFVYCIALELAGKDTVLESVGVEPSGDAFNGIL